MSMKKLIFLIITMNLKLYKTKKPLALDEKPQKGYVKGYVFFSPNSLIHIEIRLKMNILCGSLVKRVDYLRWVWPF